MEAQDLHVVGRNRLSIHLHQQSSRILGRAVGREGFYKFKLVNRHGGDIDKVLRILTLVDVTFTRISLARDKANVPTFGQQLASSGDRIGR